MSQFEGEAQTFIMRALDTFTFQYESIRRLNIHKALFFSIGILLFCLCYNNILFYHINHKKSSIILAAN